MTNQSIRILLKYLAKGSYTIHLIVRHHKASQLEKLKDSVLYIKHTLVKSIKQDVYLNHIEALNGGTRVDTAFIRENNNLTFYLNPIAWFYLPAEVDNGHFLSGILTIFSDKTLINVN